METRKSDLQDERKRFQLYEHPWLSLLAVIVAIVLSNIVSIIVLFVAIGLSSDSPMGQFALGMMYHILTIFIISPFVLHLPKGKRTYWQFLEDIGLRRIQPFVRLTLLALSCYLILALSQATASLLYRLFEGLPVTWSFVWQVFDISGDLPPGSSSLLIAIPSSFEEIVFRGIVLTVFLGKYSERKAIFFSSIGFGLMHLLNLVSGRELVWVIGQVVWAFIIGLFYGYIFVKTRSLLPPMIVHYLGNLFLGSLTSYIQTRASIEIQVLYGVIFTLGMIPTVLMILWTRFFSSKWLDNGSDRI